MPDGRTGGFCLRRNDLHQMLNDCESNAIVGHVVERKRGIASKLRQVLAGKYEFTRRQLITSELRQVLSKWKGDEIKVEEQDHKFYIVHLSKWVTIEDRSPLFDRFRQHHAEWLKETARKIGGPD